MLNKFQAGLANIVAWEGYLTVSKFSALGYASQFKRKSI